MADKKEIKEGWAKPGRAMKFHYYVDTQSLCGDKTFFGKDLSEDEGITRLGDCKACAHKMEKRRLLVKKD